MSVFFYGFPLQYITLNNYSLSYVFLDIVGGLLERIIFYSTKFVLVAHAIFWKLPKYL